MLYLPKRCNLKWPLDVDIHWGDLACQLGSCPLPHSPMPLEKLWSLEFVSRRTWSKVLLHCCLFIFVSKSIFVRYSLSLCKACPSNNFWTALNNLIWAHLKVHTQNQPNKIEHLKYIKSLIFFFFIMHILEKFSLNLYTHSWPLLFIAAS